MSASPILYHVPPSFYSQVARLVLAEKGVGYQARLAAAGPPLFETHAPWYMRLTPNGTVPTLVHGEVAVPDSREILAYVDASFDGPALTPSDADARAQMQGSIAHMYDISIRELSYGSEGMAKAGQRVNGMRARHLRRRAARHPDMRAIYEAKLRDIEDFASQAVDRVRAGVATTLDALEATLAERSFLAGQAYSLADLVWTVAIARFQMINMDPLAARPSLAAWYQRMCARPSFGQAGVWEQMKLTKLLTMFARKLGPYLLGVGLVVALLVWALLALW